MLFINTQNKQRGLTLIELLVVILIVGIMALMAAPNYARMVEKSKLREAMHEWQTSFHFAQAEAMRTQRPVRMCISIDGKQCAQTSAAEAKAGNFNAGWIVMRLDTKSRDTGSVLRDVLPAAKTNMFLVSYREGSTSTESVHNIYFLGNGRIQINGLADNRALAFAVNADASNKTLKPKDGLCIIISKEGRMRLPQKLSHFDEHDYCKRT